MLFVMKLRRRAQEDPLPQKMFCLIEAVSFLIIEKGHYFRMSADDKMGRGRMSESFLS
jgi:hypothetical protein